MAKRLCSWFDVIDSFEMFKYKEGLEWVKASKDRLCFEVPQYNLKARLTNNFSFNVSCDAGSYMIPTEKKPCNYGGFYHFFRCPQCDKRMRKLYCVQGLYQCRKCASLGYYSQRLRPSQRCSYMQFKIVNSF